MSFGLQVITPDGDLSLDGDTLMAYELHSEVRLAQMVTSQTLPGPGFGAARHIMLSPVIPINATPIITISPANWYSARMGSAMYVSSTNFPFRPNPYYLLPFYGGEYADGFYLYYEETNTQPTAFDRLVLPGASIGLVDVDYQIFVDYNSMPAPLPGYGMNVYNESGALIFSSNSRPMRLIDVIDVPASALNDMAVHTFSHRQASVQPYYMVSNGLEYTAKYHSSQTSSTNANLLFKRVSGGSIGLCWSPAAQGHTNIVYEGNYRSARAAEIMNGISVAPGAGLFIGATNSVPAAECVFKVMVFDRAL